MNFTLKTYKRDSLASLLNFFKSVAVILLTTSLTFVKGLEIILRFKIVDLKLIVS